MKKLFFVFMFLSFVFAESQISQAVNSLKNSMSLITLIILFTFVFSAFVYAFGKILNMGSLKAWAKDQVYEAFLSMFIGLITIFILENFFLNQNFNALLSSSSLLPNDCKNKIDLFEITDCELSIFLNHASDLLWSLFGANLAFSIASQFSFSSKIPIEGGIFKLDIEVSLPLLQYLFSDLSDAVASFYYFLLASFILNSFQIYLLRIAPYLFLILFPAGVVLRSFGLTRKIGGSLIAISIGISLLFPILIAIGYGYLLSSNYPFLLSFSFGSFVTAWFSGLASALLSQLGYGAIATPVFLLGVVLPTIINVEALIIGLFFTNTLATYILGLFIIPYIIFDVLENFIRGFSSQIGQEVSVLGWMGRLL
jgi:hypothetical protein